MAGMVRDVPGIPAAQLRQQVGRVAPGEAFLPVRAQEGLEVRRAERREVQPGAIEILAQRPAGIDPPEGALGAARGRAEAGDAVIFRRRFQHRHQPGEEDPVVHAGARAAAIDDDPPDGLWEERSPVIGLLRAHRPAIDGVHPPHAEHLSQKSPLRRDIVPGRDQRRPVGVVAGRRRKPAAEHVRDDDAPARRVQHAVRPDQPFDVRMLRGVAGGIDDDVVPRGGQRAMRPPDDARAAQHAAAMQRQVAGLEHAFPHRPAHVPLHDP